MFAALLTKAFWGMLWGRVRTNASHDWQAIPAKDRLWIIGAVVVVLLGIAHQWYAHHQLRKAFNDGYAKAVADIKKAEAAKVAPLKQAKQESEARLDVKQAEVKKVHDTQLAHIDSNVAKLLGMYTSPTGGDRAQAGGGVPAADAQAGARSADPRANDGLAAQPAAGAAEPTITVPAKQLIARSGICDRDYIALKAWEQTWRDYDTVYKDWLAKTRKVK